jgi:hypothetical protein
VYVYVCVCVAHALQPAAKHQQAAQRLWVLQLPFRLN